MTEQKIITINGRNYYFYNESYGNRTGFAHKSELFSEGCCLGKARRQYYNRTWERYTFESVMKDICRDLMEESKRTYKEEWKRLHDYKKLTAKRKEKMESDFSTCPPADYVEYKSIYDAL